MGVYFPDLVWAHDEECLGSLLQGLSRVLGGMLGMIQGRDLLVLSRVERKRGNWLSFLSLMTLHYLIPYLFKSFSFLFQKMGLKWAIINLYPISMSHPFIRRALVESILCIFLSFPLWVFDFSLGTF